MDCATVKLKMVGFVDGDLDAIEHNIIGAHIDVCPVCKAELGYERLLRSSLANLQFPEPSPAFKNRISGAIKSASDTSKSSPIGWFSAGFATALAGTVAAWMVLSPALKFESFDEKANYASIDKQQVVVSLNHVDSIRVAFDSPKSFDDIELTLLIPDHLEIDGYPGEKILNWHASINEGRNVLTIPLFAKENKPGVIVAQIKDGEKVKTFEINAVVRPNGNVLLDNRDNA